MVGQWRTGRLYCRLSDVYDTRAGIGDKNKVKNEGFLHRRDRIVRRPHLQDHQRAHRDGHTDTVIDFDNTPDPALDVPAFYDDRQFTQEFQPFYEGERLQGVFGLFCLDARAKGAFDTVVGALGRNDIDVRYGEDEELCRICGISAMTSPTSSNFLPDCAGRDDKTGTVFRRNYTAYAARCSAMPQLCRDLHSAPTTPMIAASISSHHASAPATSRLKTSTSTPPMAGRAKLADSGHARRRGIHADYGERLC